ncbi:glycosyltransferase family 2 protein [uncultured Algoriphagus sp.]|uniref:glycosyltransferase family 2 protein n=1 Tax=uncultured Algoriphagus sp. TaxID=417365 RepID=UPI0030EC330F|tara:strand:- start:20606 stop:21490 length:885 start_codon:yes stop_codon:yes gene_type:complete
MKKNVDLVIVTYLPNRDQLKKGIESLKFQVRNIIVVSNGPDDFSNFGIIYIHIPLNENLGIGKAQNKGIDMAIRLGADFILTADQDTIFPLNYVENVLGIYEELSSEGRNIAALGPIFRDENHKGRIHSMVRFKKFGLAKIHPAKIPESVSHFISSGMVIPASAFLVIGKMKEDFFMDWVDTEWCWRAQKHGFENLQIPTLIVSHELGQYTRSHLGVSITTHSKTREYYKIRNAILLLKDVNYRTLPIFIYLSKFIAKSVVVNLIKGLNDYRNLKVVYASILHGIIGRTGKWTF